MPACHDRVAAPLDRLVGQVHRIESVPRVRAQPQVRVRLFGVHRNPQVALSWCHACHQFAPIAKVGDQPHSAIFVHIEHAAGRSETVHPNQINITDSYFKRNFSPTSTLSLRRANRQPRENRRKPFCFPRTLALRSVRFSQFRAPARARAEPSHRLQRKLIRVCESSRLK